MASKTQYGRIALISLAKSAWNADVILLKGEIGIETDTGLFKIGDGATTWSALNYANEVINNLTSDSTVAALSAAQGKALKAAIDEVAQGSLTVPVATNSKVGGILSQTDVVGGVKVEADGKANVAEVAKAQKLSTARTITLAGDATGNVSFDGSADAELTVAIADVSADKHGLMTSAQKASLAELVSLKPAEAGAQVNKIETVKVDGVALNITDKAVNVDLSGKVDKVQGKSLIDDAEITRLAGMETGAQVNKIEKIALKNNGDADFIDLAIVGKKVSIDLSAYAKLSDVAAGINFKGSVATYADLAPLAATAKAGDVYFCKDTNAEYIWVPADDAAGVTAHFEEFGNVIALDGYYTKGEVDNLVAGAKTYADGKVEAEAEARDQAIATAKSEITGAYEAADQALQANIDKKVDKVTGKSLVDDTAIAKLTGGAVVDGNAGFVTGDQVHDAIAAMPHENTTYTFAEGSTNGKFTVTPSNGSAQEVAIHGLGTAAYTSSDAYVPASKNDAIDSAVQTIELTKNGDVGSVSKSGTTVTVDISGYATTANVATAKSEAISAASADATTKANNAKEAAISDAASKYVNVNTDVVLFQCTLSETVPTV